MSKVICDICGTSFPESATQCPICGCVRPAEAVSVPESDEAATTGYTYVKGGRFSKANVRKRNQMAAKAAGTADHSVNQEHQESSGKRTAGLIIALTCAVLILACLVLFVVTQWSGGLFGLFDSNQSQDDIESVPCTSIDISVTEFTLKNPGETAKIEITVKPYNTTDEIKFISSDKSVATVSISGKIEYVSAGEADITVICGGKSVVCHVICEEFDPVTVPPTETDPPLPVIELDRTDIKGEDVIAGAFQWPLYDQQKNSHLSAEEITWISDDPEIATVDEFGVVYAESAGTTVIRAIYNGEMLAYCNITVIDEAGVTEDPEGNVTEPDPTDPSEPSQGTGKLTPYTQYGSTYSEGENKYSITLNAGESVDLFLKDADGNKVSVTWTVKEGDCTLNENGQSVKVNGDETCKLQAEYEGKTYTLVIY